MVDSKFPDSGVPENLSGEIISPYDNAVKLVENKYDWIDWSNEKEIKGKSICTALAWLEGSKKTDIILELSYFLNN